jgi:cytochrome c peroxidase
MIRRRTAGVAAGIVLACVSLCLQAAQTLAGDGWTWQLPSGFPPPLVPADNPMTPAKVELGRHLFYDARLSGNGTQSCASCHEQARAFTDGRARSVGSTGQMHARGSMSLVNVAYASVLTWANPSMTRLEQQALVPMYGDHPIELGLDRSDRWLEIVGRDPVYQRLVRDAFGGEPISRTNAVHAIASFERSIVSARSPYDRYHFDRDDSAVSDAAKRGEVLFHSRPLSCFMCHGGLHFSNAMGPGERRGPSEFPVEFHNTGLYNLAGLLSYPEDNTGIYETTHDAKDVGKFKAPTLRNVAVTAPYMHDGSVATLEDAIDHYAAGGRTIADGPYRGSGRDNPNKSPSIHGFTLTTAQRADLVAFLQSLTDEAVLHDPRFANPWTPAERP